MARVAYLPALPRAWCIDWRWQRRHGQGDAATRLQRADSRARMYAQGCRRSECAKAECVWGEGQESRGDETRSHVLAGTLKLFVSWLTERFAVVEVCIYLHALEAFIA